jgi:predicted RNA-binding Zn-ribbon protein involved in translation (DUF1610 family)
MRQLSMFEKRQRKCTSCKTPFVPLYEHKTPLCPDCLDRLCRYLVEVVDERRSRNGKAK